MINIIVMKNIIPGYMPILDCEILVDLFSPYNNKITFGIDIGSFLGRSSYEIIRAIPLCKLYCIDPWSGWEVGPPGRFHISGQYFPLQGTKCSLSEFSSNINKCDNIIPIQGSCPECVSNWTESVTFVFLDAAHYNPSDRKSIDFWLPKINSGGLFVGHDYIPCMPDRYPDIHENIKYLEEKLEQKVSCPNMKSSIWYFRI